MEELREINHAGPGLKGMLSGMVLLWLNVERMGFWVLENPGRKRNLADQKSEDETEWHPNQRSQGEFEQRLKMDPAQRESQQDNHRNMNDIDGKCLLG